MKTCSLFLALMLALVIGDVAIAEQAPSPPTDGADAQASLRLYRLGRAHFRAGRYRAAIESLSRAQRLFGHRNNLYYLGASYRRLGQHRKSFQFYKAYALQFPPPRRQELLQRYERVLRHEPPCTLSIGSRPGGARIEVDGVFRAMTPAAGRTIDVVVSGGPHRVTLRHPGRRPVHWTVTAEFGESQARHFALRASGPPTTAKALRRAAASPPRADGALLSFAVGPSIAGYGDGTPAARWTTDLSLAAGYLWRWQRWGLFLRAELHYRLSDDARDAYAGVLTPALGAGGRLALSRRLFVQLGAALGAALLLGVSEDTFFLQREGQTLREASGTFGLFALRASAGLGVVLWRRFSLLVLPALVQYSPSSGDLSQSIDHLFTYTAQLGLCWSP